MEELKQLPVAIQTATANEQHYEVRARCACWAQAWQHPVHPRQAPGSGAS